MVRRSKREMVRKRLKKKADNPRFQHELKEMQETSDLRKIDDDVEDVATLLEWYAPEHEYQPKSPKWFMSLAIIITILMGIFLVNGNVIAAITMALVGGLIYVIAQHKPSVMRYRILVEGPAVNDTLYHFKNLDSFNIIYEPGEVKTVILRSKKRLAPLVHLEIGDMDPVVIRDVLLEFLQEDQELEEPAVDVWARRLGF
jgi:hypothetical protein